MSGNRYELPKKLQNLTPYDPLTGHYRIRLDANESFLSPPPELMEELMAAVMAVDFNRYPDPYAVELCENAPPSSALIRRWPSRATARTS